MLPKNSSLKPSQVSKALQDVCKKLSKRKILALYKDFAHAPSKVKATVKALKEIYPSRDLVACLELHSLSSLSKKFIPQYKDSMKSAQVQIVYFNAEKMKVKKIRTSRRTPISERALLLPTCMFLMMQKNWKNFFFSNPGKTRIC